MLSILFAAALLQAAPTAAAQAPAPGSLQAAEAPRDNGLPKDDYGLVAWCHGALAGQLELDPIAHKDMEQIEGKAKVAARAKEDAELTRERRAYLKDYEHALAAAEAASPTAIHQQGVDAELRGFRMWNETRNKAPIWRMLDWGMWDSNDAGCSDAAKRLYAKASLFGEALKGSDSSPAKPGAAPDAKWDTRPDTPASKEPAAETPAAPASEAVVVAAEPTPVKPAKTEKPPARKPAKAVKAKPVEPKPAEPVQPAQPAPPEPAAAPPADAAVTTPAPAAEPAPVAKPVVKKAKTRTAKAKPADSEAEAIRDAIAKGKAETESSTPAATPAPAPATPANDPGLRGPQ